MPNKMLIDASHPEETRVVVLRGNRIEEFDFESQDKKQLKGNIYLARVTRVEPSLQAAFVEYGGNRHGFLAFSEIHPDYYQIPVADRQALLRAEADAARAEDDDEDEENSERGRGRRRRRNKHRGRSSGEKDASASQSDDDDSGVADDENASDEVSADEADVTVDGVSDTAETHDSDDDASPAMAAGVQHETVSEAASAADEDHHDGHPDGEIDTVGSEDAIDEARDRRRPVRRQYKIQEVIKRRQILLVQVVKEERGNKGAALTTYMSLAGRYSVLMPNTARGGGISRKITNAGDRKRLKEVVKDLDVPQGMGVILRTAGESRTKAEIKRDYEYLMRLWDNVRTLTLQSSAPALVYEEGSLIKRSVRDLYNKDIDDIQVAGEEGYREAKDFMRMLMPSHAKVVQPYRDNVPLFVRHGVEAQLDKMLQPQVTLKSGGYIIINQTEALVSIDVNSGRSTREHSIEDTALQTNLEAAEEVARQLRLRDLAGLIVIDFIDMEENRNNRAVEKRMKDCLKNDRARIQVGRISHFGLLEMSRQRIRASVLESTMQPCPHCGGTGHVRSESSVALLVVRAIEEYLLRDSRNHIIVRTPASTAFYVLNHKRRNLADLEARFGLTITVEADNEIGAQHYVIVKGAVAEKVDIQPPVMIEPPALEPEDELEDVADETADEEENESETARPVASEEGDQTRRKRRRRRRRGGRNRDHDAETGAADDKVDAGSDTHGSAMDEESAEGETPDAVSADAEHQDDGGQTKRRRRGKRGGRRNRPEGEGEADAASAEQQDGMTGPEGEAVASSPETAAEVAPVAEQAPAEGAEPAEAATGETALVEAPKKPARRSRAKSAKTEALPNVDEPQDPPAKKPARSRSRKKADIAPSEPESAEIGAVTGEAEQAKHEAGGEEADMPKASDGDVEQKPSEPIVTSAQPAAENDDRPRRTGWWQRKGFFGS